MRCGVYKILLELLFYIVSTNKCIEMCCLLTIFLDSISVSFAAGNLSKYLGKNMEWRYVFPPQPRFR